MPKLQKRNSSRLVQWGAADGCRWEWEWDQALSLWSGSTDSKTLDPKYQIVRTHTRRKPLEYKIWHHPTTSSIQCRIPHLNNKQNKNTNQIISRQDYHLPQPCSSEEKQNKQTQHKSLSVLVPQPGMEPIFLAVEAWKPNHWTSS